MSFVLLYDANVLYPSTLRDLLIRLAQAGLVQAKWTDKILDESSATSRLIVGISTQPGWPAHGSS